MDQLWTSLVSIATAIVGVAIIAVIVSRNADTANVITSAGNAFSGALGVAVSPVTGAGYANFSPNINFSGNSLLR